MAQVKKSYSAADIEVLEGLEPVRKRPGMYIAGTDTPAGLHQLLFEIIDNSVDEAMNGHADCIEVILHEDGCSATVKDNGRGIPVDLHPVHKRPALELILTTLHAGGKFSDKNYKTAGGLHGVGSSVVNALSEEMIATVLKEGKEHVQKFSRGVPQGAMKVSKAKSVGTGTSIFFRPDPEIFPQTNFSTATIKKTLKSRAYLNPGLRLVFRNEVAGETEEYFYPDGIRAYFSQLLEEARQELVGGETFFLQRQDDVEVDLVFGWTESTKEEFICYANGIHTPDGGSHEVGAKSGIVKAIRNYITVHDIPLKGIKLGAEDIREGLFCILAVKLPGGRYQAQFQGQTKSKLNNPEVSPLVENVARGLENLLNERPTIAQAIVNRIVLAAKARAASRDAGNTVRRKLGVSHRLTLPGKLADCSSNRSEHTELLIVEGDSAGGSAKQGRDRNTQAVLPLRGKVLNTVNSTAKKVAENKELANVIAALGAGSGEGFRKDKLRYGRVIILTDADADGMHIATLLLAFFFQHMRPLIESGGLFLGKPPLYKIATGAEKVAPSRSKAAKKSSKAGGKASADKTSKGSAVYWAYSDEEMQKIISQNKLRSPRITRYKGLGEMNPETLWETTLDPEHRTLLRVSVKDEEQVLTAFQHLMGSDPAMRYKLICERAANIEVDV